MTVVAHELQGFRPVGGMGTATTLLALALARMGHSVEILLGPGSPDSLEPYWQRMYDQAGVRLRRAPRSDEPVEPWHFADGYSIALALRADPPDVVVAHDLGGPAYCALRLRQAGIAFEHTLFVVFCHGTRQWILDVSRRLDVPDLEHVFAFGALEKGSIELADVVVSPSAYLVAWMRAQGWRLPEQTFVIPYLTRPTATGEPLPQRTHAEEDAPVRRLVFFGRLEEKKGIKPFAAALNTLEPELLAEIEIEFIGKPTGTWPPERVEELLSEPTRQAVRAVSFEGDLNQPDALARLGREGTLVVMPSLSDNSPNTVYECLERGIPFIASNVGGIPELIAPEDRARVLFEPTPEGTATALRQALGGRQANSPPRPAFDPAASFRRWAELIELQLRPQPPDATGHGDVVVHGLREQDVPDPDLQETLIRAQRVSGADVVTCGLRLVGDDGQSTLHFFAGEPDGSGALANGYGTVGLFRREVLDDLTATGWPAVGDPEWPLLARLSVSGAKILSIPLPLVTRHARPGSVHLDSNEALLVAMEFERALPDALRGTARLAAGLAANTASSPPARASFVRRALQRLSRGSF